MSGEPGPLPAPGPDHRRITSLVAGPPGDPVCGRSSTGHRELELRLVVAGRTSMNVGGRSVRIGEATICWIFPGQAHHTVSSAGDLEGWVVRTGEAVPDLEWLRGTGSGFLPADWPGEPLLVRVNATDQRWLYERLAELADLPGELPEVGAGLRYVLLRAWRLSASSHDPAPAASTTVLRATRTLTDPTQADTWSTTALARRLGVSAGHLERRFRAETGRTVTQFRLYSQLQRYLDLCDDDHSLSITDAAFRAGFGSYSQFHRIFVRELGVNPSSHRANRRRAGSGRWGAPDGAPRTTMIDMTEQEDMLTVTVRGGDHDGDVFELPAEQAGAGDTIGYLDGQYRLARGQGHEWIARAVPPGAG